MRRRLLFGAALGIALLYACGGSDSGQPGDNADAGDDATADTGGGGGDGSTPGDGGGIDSAPTPSPYGLDTRPSNATCVAKPRPPLQTKVTLQRVWNNVGFDTPIHLKQAPGDDTRWYIVERNGTVRWFPSTATSSADLHPFASLSVNAGGEGGLLSMAFSPNWKNKPELYVDFTRSTIAGDPAPPARCGVTSPAFTEVIARMTSADGGNTLGAPVEILKVAKPFSNHNGGNIAFGPDGMLYAAFGDGGNGDDSPCKDGQALDTWLGKFIRIDVSGGGAYTVPPDNPFIGTAGALPEIWTLGMRNPWRWSFDTATGDLWAGDVGQSTWEEIDRIQKGGNYGWSICEGFHKHGSTSQLCATPGLIDPIVEHGRDAAGCIIGGYVYRGASIPTLVGTYIYGDYLTGNVWALEYDVNNKPVPTLITTLSGQSLVSFAQGNDGEVYTVQIGGVIQKLVPSGTPPPDTFPKLLSLTGCVDPKDPTKPAPGVIPYDVISPLWSDGAKKERFLAVPDGKTIAVGADNDWDLPVGSVAMKTFWVAGKRVETRLFMRHDDGGDAGTDAGGDAGPTTASGWAGYTYEWNDAQTDATLLPAGKVKPVGTQTWTYPSRTQCIQCHSQAAGGTIGLETWQLNKDAVYPSTNRVSNQLATLEHIGMFSAALGKPPDQLPKLPDPAGADALDARARSYLHANCSHCHRPNGGGQGTMDLRFGTSFHDTQTCNADPTQGQVEGVTDGKILLPGAPAKSILSLRVHAADSKRMPPVAVTILDPLGSKLLDDWITSVTTCP